MTSQKSRVIQLYKTLLYMGRDYPTGYSDFRQKCHRAFLKNRNETDPEVIEKLISHGEYVVNEIKALYMLKKYRTLKRRYYETPDIEQYVEKLQDVKESNK